MTDVRSQQEQVYDARRAQVEVVRRGQVPSERIHEVTCRNCNSDLRFRESVAHRVFDQRDGDYFEVPCPVCGATVTKTV
jgi:RNase P subunit RPR2